MKKYFILLSFVSLNSFAILVDGVELSGEKVVNGISMCTGKKDSMRTYRGFVSKEYNVPMEAVKKAVINFDEKCNNDFKKKRKHMSKDVDCKFKNENLVESVIRKDIKTNYTKETNETERYIVTRYIHKQGDHLQHDLMTVYQYKNDKKEDVYQIKQKMLTDNEAQSYLANPEERDTAFNDVIGNFIITKKGENKTLFEYEYISKTDHWILNKEGVASQVYESMASGITNLLDSIEKGSK